MKPRSESSSSSSESSQMLAVDLPSGVSWLVLATLVYCDLVPVSESEDARYALATFSRREELFV